MKYDHQLYRERAKNFNRLRQNRSAQSLPPRTGKDEEAGYQSDDDRSWWDRAGDEVLSWMGDDYAERRRRHDAPNYRGVGPKNYKRSDDRIRDEINDRLTDEWNVDASDIEVNVLDGEVILTGYVTDRYQKRRAEVVAENVLGVRNVENRMRVEPTTPNVNRELMF